MAEDGERGSDRSNYLKNNSRPNNDNSSDDENEPGASLRPDIGLGNNGHHLKRTAEAVQTGSSSTGDQPRREENPFSFKHFLNQDVSGGARPKVYTTKSSAPPRIIANPELASGLPDFVQDHLVIEQCFLNQHSQPMPAVDMSNLAEFEIEESNEGWHNGRPGDLPFDLTESRHEHLSEPSRVPLDLPQGLPFDLPCNPSSGEVGASTSLPDFLSDGPIRSGRRPEGIHPSEPSSPVISPHPHHPLMQSLQSENERLRREQETFRRQLSDQLRRNESLETQLRILRSRDHEDTAGTVRQLEENLTRAVKRAEAAEMKAIKLKQEIKLLTMDRDSQGACGPSTSSDRSRDQRLAADLRAAVTGAEHNLRQMLSGVDSLRRIASTLENRHRFENHPVFSEPDDRDTSGPAL